MPRSSAGSSSPSRTMVRARSIVAGSSARRTERAEKRGPQLSRAIVVELTRRAARRACGRTIASTRCWNHGRSPGATTRHSVSSAPIMRCQTERSSSVAKPSTIVEEPCRFETTGDRQRPGVVDEAVALDRREPGGPPLDHVIEDLVGKLRAVEAGAVDVEIDRRVADDGGAVRAGRWSSSGLRAAPETRADRRASRPARATESTIARRCCRLGSMNRVCSTVMALPSTPVTATTG